MNIETELTFELNNPLLTNWSNYTRLPLLINKLTIDTPSLQHGFVPLTMIHA